MKAIIIFFLGIFFLQILASGLYALGDKIFCKNPKSFSEIWMENFKGMLTDDGTR